MPPNPPSTVWQTTDGLSDISSTGVNNIVDTLVNFLVDPSGIFVVDTGVTSSLIPSTIWTEDNSI